MNNFQSCSILVVDDELAILKLLDHVLSRKGFQIDTVSCGEAGLEKIKSGQYNLVITDIKMPGIGGEEFARVVKDLKGECLPVIGMSGTPWLLDCNLFDAVLSKPFLKNDLYDAIAKVVPVF